MKKQELLTTEDIMDGTMKTLVRLKIVTVILATVAMSLMAFTTMLVVDVYHATEELVKISNDQMILSEMNADVNAALANNYRIGKELYNDAYTYYETTDDKEFKFIFDHAGVDSETDLGGACAKLYALAEAYPEFAKHIDVKAAKETIAVIVTDIEDSIRSYNTLVENYNQRVDTFNNRIYCKMSKRSIEKESPMNLVTE